MIQILVNLYNRLKSQNTLTAKRAKNWCKAHKGFNLSHLLCDLGVITLRPLRLNNNFKLTLKPDKYINNSMLIKIL